MPLYDMIVLVKIGEAQVLGGILKGIVSSVYQGGGVVRNIRNLGDRISARQYKAKDGSKTDFVRYLSICFDGDPSNMKETSDYAKKNNETLGVYVTKIKDKDYYKEILDKEYFAKFENFEISPAKRNEFTENIVSREIAKELASKYDQAQAEDSLNFGLKENKLI